MRGGERGVGDRKGKGACRGKGTRCDKGTLRGGERGEERKDGTQRGKKG